MNLSIVRKASAALSCAVIACCLVGVLAGCSSSASSSASAASSSAASASASASASGEASSTAAPESIAITDLKGNQVEVPYQPENMIMNWPGGLSVVLMFDQDDNMAAYMAAVSKGRYAWMQKVAPAILNKPAIEELTAEEALNYNCDLMIVRNAKEAEPYAKAGIATICMQQNNVEELKAAVKAYGEIFGKQDVADAYSAYLDDTVSLIQSRIADIPESERPLVYTMNTQHVADFTNTDGRNSVTESYFETAGGILSTAELGEGLNFDITAEQIVAIDPDIIVVTGGNELEVYDKLLADPTLGQLKAVTSGNAYVVPSGIHTWTGSGPECALYMMWLAKTFYPDRFADIDMTQRTHDFYQQFYGVDFSGEEMEAIMAGYPNLKSYQEAK